MLSAIQLKLIAAALVVAMVAGGLWYVYDKGFTSGRADGQRTQLEEDKKSFEGIRKEAFAKLDEYKTENTRLNSEVDQKNAELASLKAQRAATRQAVSRMSDPEVAKALEGVDKRELLAIMRDYPTLVEQLKVQEATTLLLEKKVVNVEKALQASITYGNEVTVLYVKAYNAAQKRPNWFVRAITLGQYHGRHLDLPAPATLSRPN